MSNIMLCNTHYNHNHLEVRPTKHYTRNAELHRIPDNTRLDKQAIVTFHILQFVFRIVNLILFIINDGYQTPFIIIFFYKLSLL